MADASHSGNPTTYLPKQMGEIIVVSLTGPQTLRQPFGAWTLYCLVAYLHEEQRIGM